MVLAEHDHISVCKPADTDDPAYARLMAFLRTRVHALRLRRAEVEAQRLDHMEVRHCTGRLGGGLGVRDGLGVWSGWSVGGWCGWGGW